MAVGLDIGVGLQGVEQPMAGVFVCGVQIMIEASPGSGGGPDGEVVQKGGAKREYGRLSCGQEVTELTRVGKPRIDGVRETINA